MEFIPLDVAPATINLLAYDYGQTPLVMACASDGGLLRVSFVLAAETQATALIRIEEDCACHWPQAQIVQATPDFKPDLQTAYLYGTPFQQDVWQALANLQTGETITYRELAMRIGRPLAVRAVGGAVGANPFAPFVPCHRVLATAKGSAAIGGFMRGYSGGLDLKRRLLAAEGIAV